MLCLLGISTNHNNNILLYIIVVPLLILGFIFLIFCLRQRKNPHHHSHYNDSIKSSIKPRQPLIQHNSAMVPSTISRTSNDYLADSVDSIPIPRQYQQPRYGPSDLASLTSSNLYYARVQAI